MVFPPNFLYKCRPSHVSNRFALCTGGIFNFDYVIFPSHSTTEPGEVTYNQFFERVRWEHYRRPPREWKIISIKDDHKRVDAWYRPIPPFDISKDPCGTWLHFGDLPLNGKKGVIRTLKVTNPTRDGLPIFRLTEGGKLVPVTTIEEDGSESAPMMVLEFEIATTLLYEEILEQSGRQRGSSSATTPNGNGNGNGNGGGGDNGSSSAPPPPPPSSTSTPATPTATASATTSTTTTLTDSIAIATPSPATLKHKSTVVVTADEDGPTPVKRRFLDSGPGLGDYNGEMDVTFVGSCDDDCDASKMMVDGDKENDAPPPPPPFTRRHHNQNQFEDLASMIGALHLPDQTRKALQPCLNNLRDLLMCKIDRIEKTVNSMNGASRQGFRNVIDSVARVATTNSSSNPGANNEPAGSSNNSSSNRTGRGDEKMKKKSSLVQSKLDSTYSYARSRSAGRLGGTGPGGGGDISSSGGFFRNQSGSGNGNSSSSQASGGSSQGNQSRGPFLSCTSGGDDDELEIVNQYNPVPPSPSPRSQSAAASPHLRRRQEPLLPPPPSGRSIAQSPINERPPSNFGDQHQHQQQQQQQRRLSSNNTAVTTQQQQQRHHKGGDGERSSSSSSNSMYKYLHSWSNGSNGSNGGGGSGNYGNNTARRGGGGGVSKR